MARALVDEGVSDDEAQLKVSYTLAGASKSADLHHRIFGECPTLDDKNAAVVYAQWLDYTLIDTMLRRYGAAFFLS